MRFLTFLYFWCGVFEFIRWNNLLDAFTLDVSVDDLLSNGYIFYQALLHQIFKLTVGNGLRVRAGEVVLNHQKGDKGQYEKPDWKLLLFFFHSYLFPVTSQTY